MTSSGILAIRFSRARIQPRLAPRQINVDRFGRRKISRVCPASSEPRSIETHYFSRRATRVLNDGRDSISKFPFLHPASLNFIIKLLYTLCTYYIY